MKVAFIGNMNNNNFAIMRFFRDLGADAHLLLWAGDGADTLTHFTPENDTWHMEKWRPYIHRMDIVNGRRAFFGFSGNWKLPPSAKYVEEYFGAYDRLVGSGLAPAVVGKCGRALDIFYPYATGIEFVAAMPDMPRLRSKNPVKRLINQYLRKKQMEGILRTRFCLNAEMGTTRQQFEKMGKAFLPLSIPMVYNREEADPKALPERLVAIAKRMEQYDFKCFTHARQMWARQSGFSPEEWASYNKNNDWLIGGFAQYLKSDPQANALLIALEYGPDVDRSKALIRELGIEKRVLWLPKMPRKELMYILGLCEIGVGEFTIDPGCIWGGTGWEVMAAGKPLLQSFNFSEDGYRQHFGHPPPPILDVKSQDDVALHLRAMAADRKRMKAVGERSRDWFNEHNGIGLAKKWLDLLVDGGRSNSIEDAMKKENPPFRSAHPTGI